MPDNEPYDFEMLHLLATTCPDPATIDWRAEYARLCDDADKTETDLRKQIKLLSPPATPAQPFLDCATRLAQLTGHTVSVDPEMWSYSDGRQPNHHVRIFVLECPFSSTSAPTLAEAEAKVRELWEKHCQAPSDTPEPPLPMAEIIGKAVGPETSHDDEAHPRDVSVDDLIGGQS